MTAEIEKKKQKSKGKRSHGSR